MNRIRIVLVLAGLATLTGALAAQDQRNEQFYYPGSFNWQFLSKYPEGGRLFNAFDYGHAVLYEKLYTRPRDLVAELETRQYNYLTTELLVRPPRFAVAEEAIEPAYAKLAWRAKMMFDWAHVLHRQIYDVYADERLSRAEQDQLIERITDYYLSNQRLAFAAVPKSMTLMDEQYYSQVFRRGYPKFNGLIWAYHWLQVGLYEPLIEGRTPSEKKAGVQATIARFWTMLEDAPARFPKVMPMTPVIAPKFTEAHPRAAIIFDNLHMTHDIISDILAADTVPAARKRKVIYAALDEMQDTTRNVMSVEEWHDMGNMMGGVAIMGGPATGLLPVVPTLGAEMPEMGGMARMNHGAQDSSMTAMPGMGAGGDSTAGHDMRAMPDSSWGHKPGMHNGHDMSGMAMPGMMGDSSTQAPMRMMMDMHARMMADPVMHQRMMADTAMQRMLLEMMVSMPAGAMGGMMNKPVAADSVAAGHGHHPSVTPVRPKSRRPPAKKPQPSSTDSMPGMDHSQMPAMRMPKDSTRP
ncbi:MAG: hypothetical protein SGJ01_16910 [Gemmatimonadota bacterium]|nr:hypothetical protein [Gemmatimonadota bacterium]